MATHHGMTRRGFVKTVGSAPALSFLRQGLGPRIVVVGAGAFGGWTAWHLLRAGAEVTLVDPWGGGHSRASSGGDSRVIRGMYGADSIYPRLVARSHELWGEAERRWSTKIYHRTGGLWMFGEDDSFARSAAPHMKANGLPLERVSLRELEERFPAVRADGVVSAYYEPRAGYLLARRACRLVQEEFTRAHGTFVLGEASPGPIASERMRSITLSDGSTLEADSFVFACGPWLGALFPEVIGDRVRPTRQEIFYFGVPASRAKAYQGLPVWADFAERLFYGVPGSEGRGFKVADDTHGAVVDPTTMDRTPSAAGIRNARELLARRFPELVDAPLVEARVCQYENSPDGHYIFDRHPEASNVWFLGGGSGHGFKLCPALGEYVSERVVGKAPLDPVFRLERI